MNKRLALAVLFLALGCGDDDDDKNAPAMCQQVFDATCEKAASCRMESGDTTPMQEAVDECHGSLAEQGFDCAMAVETISDLDGCLKELDEAPCDLLGVQDDGTLANIPASCIP